MGLDWWPEPGDLEGGHCVQGALQGICLEPQVGPRRLLVVQAAQSPLDQALRGLVSLGRHPPGGPTSIREQVPGLEVPSTQGQEDFSHWSALGGQRSGWGAGLGPLPEGAEEQEL